VKRPTVNRSAVGCGLHGLPKRHPEVSEALIRWAAIAGRLGRITRGRPAEAQQRRTLTRI
jgi:hypothetical protein